MESSNKLLTLMEAAELSACSTRTLRRAIDSGQLAAVRLGQSAKSDRIRREDLEAWWNQCRLRPVAAPRKSIRDIPPPPLDTAEARLEKRLGIGANGKTAPRRR